MLLTDVYWSLPAFVMFDWISCKMLLNKIKVTFIKIYDDQHDGSFQGHHFEQDTVQERLSTVFSFDYIDYFNICQWSLANLFYCDYKINHLGKIRCPSWFWTPVRLI